MLFLILFHKFIISNFITILLIYLEWFHFEILLIFGRIILFW